MFVPLRRSANRALHTVRGDLGEEEFAKLKVNPPTDPLR
jgi:hypothetical protein